MATRIEYIPASPSFHGTRLDDCELIEDYSCNSYYKSGLFDLQKSRQRGIFDLQESRQNQVEILIGLFAESYIEATKRFRVYDSSNVVSQSAETEHVKLFTDGDQKHLELRFRELVTTWRNETMHLSSTTAIVSSFYYYQIIGLGVEVVPLILKELRENGGQWYLALRALTNENPVRAEDNGNIKKMKTAWLEWGGKKGLL